MDTNGVALELPVKPLGDPITVPPPPNPLSPAMVFDAEIPGNAFSQQIGFGSECFYWVADALNGDVGPFLIQTAPIAQANVPPGYPLDGWVGDGNTSSTVTGSPLGFNQVSITPPAGVNIGAGPGAPLISDRFFVSGHRYPLPTPP